MLWFGVRLEQVLPWFVRNWTGKKNSGFDPVGAIQCHILRRLMNKRREDMRGKEAYTSYGADDKWGWGEGLVSWQRKDLSLRMPEEVCDRKDQSATVAARTDPHSTRDKSLENFSLWYEILGISRNTTKKFVIHFCPTLKQQPLGKWYCGIKYKHSLEWEEFFLKECHN